MYSGKIAVPPGGGGIGVFLIFFNNYQRTFPWEFSKIPKFNLAENFPKTTHQDKE
jgi:hypothetical protein